MERVRKTQDSSVLGKTHTLPSSSPINKWHIATHAHTIIQGYRGKKLKKRQIRDRLNTGREKHFSGYK